MRPVGLSIRPVASFPLPHRCSPIRLLPCSRHVALPSNSLRGSAWDPCLHYLLPRAVVSSRTTLRRPSQSDLTSVSRLRVPTPHGAQLPWLPAYASPRGPLFPFSQSSPFREYRPGHVSPLLTPAGPFPFLLVLAHTPPCTRWDCRPAQGLALAVFNYNNLPRITSRLPQTIPPIHSV